MLLVEISNTHVSELSMQAGSVCHDEIVFRIGVPRPKGITAFHQVIDDNKLSWIESVAAVAALTFGSV